LQLASSQLELDSRTGLRWREYPRKKYSKTFVFLRMIKIFSDKTVKEVRLPLPRKTDLLRANSLDLPFRPSNKKSRPYAVIAVWPSLSVASRRHRRENL
jgi:hypothetical protein